MKFTFDLNVDVGWMGVWTCGCVGKCNCVCVEQGVCLCEWLCGCVWSGGIWLREVEVYVCDTVCVFMHVCLRMLVRS